MLREFIVTLVLSLLAYSYSYAGNAGHRSDDVKLVAGPAADSLMNGWRKNTRHVALYEGGGNTALLIYRKGEESWDMDYLPNEIELEILDGLIRKNLYKIKNEEACLRLVSYLNTNNADKRIILNKAFRQALYLRNYIISEYPEIKPEYIRYCVDTSQHVSDRVSCEILSYDIGNVAGNVMTLESMTTIPVIRQGLRLFTRKDYLIIDEYGCRDSSRIFMYDMELRKRRYLDPLTRFHPEDRPLEFKRPEIKREENKKAYRDYAPEFAVKTDVLLWSGILPGFANTGCFVPNVSMEYYFEDRWSVQAQFAMRDKGRNRIPYKNEYPERENEDIVKMGYLYTGADLRFWPLKNNYKYLFTGLRLGYGQENSLDTFSGNEGITGHFAIMGVELGTAVPVYGGWTVELSFSAGYRYDSSSAYFYEDKKAYEKLHINKHSFYYKSVELKIVYRIGHHLKLFK